MRVTSAEMQAILAEMRRVNAEPLKTRVDDHQPRPEPTAEYREWADLLADIPTAPVAEQAPPTSSEPEPVAPQQKPLVPVFPLDQYLDDEERTRAWLKGTDMSRAVKWIHGSLPAAHHAITELAPQYECEFETETTLLPDGAFVVTAFIHRKVAVGIDTMVKKERAETEADIPLVEALMCRDLFVDSIGAYGIRKLNEAYRDEIISATP